MTAIWPLTSAAEPPRERNFLPRFFFFLSLFVLLLFSGVEAEGVLFFNLSFFALVLFVVWLGLLH